MERNSGLPENVRLNESDILLGEAPADLQSNGGSTIFPLLRMILVLALAALAIYGVVFFIRRLARPQESKDPHLKILARVPLGNDSFAVVLSLGERAWLVGGGSSGVSLISEIEDNEYLQTMQLEDAKKTSETGIRRYFDFRSLLGKPTGDGKKEPGSTHAQILRKQQERLRGL